MQSNIVILSYSIHFNLRSAVYADYFQVTVDYQFDFGACIPLRVHTVVLSAQHKRNTPIEKVREDLMEYVVKVGYCTVFVVFFTPNFCISRGISQSDLLSLSWYYRTKFNVSRPRTESSVLGRRCWGSYCRFKLWYLLRSTLMGKV